MYDDDNNNVWGVEIRKKKQDLPDHSTIKISKNTKRSWGDLLSLRLQKKTPAWNWCEKLTKSSSSSSVIIIIMVIMIIMI